MGLSDAAVNAGDFRHQVARAVETGGGIAAFPPTYKGGYERLYKFVDENTEWPSPDYGVWDPDGLEGWIHELADAGVRYCVISDQELETLEPAAVFRTDGRKAVYTYADSGGASVRSTEHRSRAFRYEIVDPWGIRPDSEVEIAPTRSEHMNYLKDRYLARGIDHVSGMASYLVYVDGGLVGGFIFARSRWGEQDRLYLLSDFAIVRDRKLSKLVAMLATSRDVIRPLETKLLQRIERVVTTAFTDRPVSMKYRGIFDLMARKPGMLNYGSEVREQSPAEIYGDWFRRYAGNEDRPRRAA